MKNARLCKGLNQDGDALQGCHFEGIVFALHTKEGLIKNLRWPWPHPKASPTPTTTQAATTALQLPQQNHTTSHPRQRHSSLPQRAKSQSVNNRTDRWLVRNERRAADIRFNEERKEIRGAKGHKAQDSRRQQYARRCLWKTLLDSRKLPACSLWLQPRLVGFRLIQSLPWLVKMVRNITY